MRLIDADTLPIKFDGHTVSVWKNDIDNAPTIDAVPVVRCRDCKWHEDEEPGLVWCSYIVESWMVEEDYCSMGEREHKS